MWCCDCRRKFVSPPSSRTIVYYRRLFVASVDSEEQSLKAIMEEGLKGDNWKSITRTEVTHNNAINCVWVNPVLKILMNVYLTDTATYIKTVSLDCSSTFL